MEAGQSIGDTCSSVLEAEFQTLLMVMQQAWIHGYRGDNKEVNKILTENVLRFDVHNWFRQVHYWRLKFEQIQFQWISRVSNKAAR